MDIKKIFLAGFVATVFNYIRAPFTNYLFFVFGWSYFSSLSNFNILEALIGLKELPPMLFLASLILNIIFTAIFVTLYKGIPGQGIKKGFYFGVLVWLAGTLPYGFQYIMMQETTMTTNLVSLLINYLFLGAVVAAIYKPSEA